MKNILTIALVITLSIAPLFVSAQLVDFGTDVAAPQNVRVAPNGAGTRITWSPPATGTPASYKVYGRFVTEPYIQQIGTATTTQYDTTSAFSGSNTATQRIYQVSAVLADGSESFLTVPEADDDTDGDALSDATEITIGTNPSNVDTDGDGIQDGKEFLIFKSNPLLADTDGNGVNDYQQLVNAINSNVAPTLGADGATTTAGTAVSINVLANDTDDEAVIPDNITISKNPLMGTAVVSNGQITYTPNSGFVGTDTFDYKIADQYGKTGTATVTVQVTLSPGVPYTLRYEMNGAVGSTQKLAEKSGQAVTLAEMATNIAGYGRNNDPEGGYLFTGVGGPVKFNTAQIQGASSATLSAWFRTKSASPYPQTILFGTTNTSYTSYFTRLGLAAGKCYGWAQWQTTSGGLDYSGATGLKSYNDGLWHKIDVTFSNEPTGMYGAVVGNTRCYIDGQLDGVGGSFNPFVYPTTINLYTIGAEQPAWGSPPPSNTFEGEVDETGITNRALTAAEILERYTAEKTPSTSLNSASSGSIVPYTTQFAADGDIGSTTKNKATGQSTIFMTEPGGLFAVEGKDGVANGAYSLGFSNSGLRIPTTMLAIPTNGFTISSWFQSSTKNSGTLFSGAGYLYNGNTYQDGISISANNTVTGSVTWSNTSSGSYQSSISGKTKVNDNKWHKVDLAVLQNPTSAFALYVDGALEAYGEANNNQVSFRPFGYGWSLGSLLNMYNIEYQSNKFTGAIDDTSVTYQYLTAKQIKDRYTSEVATVRSSPSYTPPPAYDIRFLMNGLPGTAQKTTDLITATDSILELNNPASVVGRDGATDGAYGCAWGNTCLKLSTNYQPNMSGFSASGWTKTTYTTADKRIVFGTFSTIAPIQMAVSLFAGKPRLELMWQDAGVNRGLTINAVNSIADGNWHKIDAVLNNTPNALARLYVDGVLVAEGTAAWPYKMVGNTFWAVGYGMTYDYLPSLAPWESFAFLYGSLDDFGITKRALTSAEVAARAKEESTLTNSTLAGAEDDVKSGTVEIRQLNDLDFAPPTLPDQNVFEMQSQVTQPEQNNTSSQGNENAPASSEETQTPPSFSRGSYSTSSKFSRKLVNESTSQLPNRNVY